MTDINQVYTGAWLKAEHLQGHDAKVTIASATVAELTDSRTGKLKKQIVLKFSGKDAQLGLNVTNAKQIAKNLGVTDTAGWVGKSITLYPTETELGGQTVACIRIRPVVRGAIPIPQLKISGVGTPIKQAVVESEVENPAPFDDEITF